MSRSERHTPISGITTARSEKRDKQRWHRRLRAAVREALARGDEVMPVERDVSDPWSMAKDGKTWWSGWLTWKHRGGK